MSEKCKCINSRMFPHRVDKCMLASKSKKEKVDAPPVPEPPPPPAANAVENDAPPIPPVTPPVEDFSPSAANVDDLSVEPAEAEAVVLMNNELVVDGNEQCDCVAYKLHPHRKNKCRWKKHVLVGAIAAVAVAGAITAAVLISQANKSSENTGDDTELSTGVEQISLTDEISAAAARSEEDNRIRAQEEETRRAVEALQAEKVEQERIQAEISQRQAEEEAQRLQVEEERSEAQEAEQRIQRLHAQRMAREEQERLLRERIAQQNEQLRRQELENERLRQAAAASARIYQQQNQVNQNMYIQNNVSYQQSYNTPTRVSRPTYGTTQAGTTCKNCIKQGGRCHQHR